MQSVQVSCACASLLIASVLQTPEHPKEQSVSGHDSIVTIANELLTTDSGDPIPQSLCCVCCEYINQRVEEKDKHGVGEKDVLSSARFLLA